MSREFYETRRLFIDYTHFTENLSYHEWMESPDDLKAAILYIQFFDEIISSWFKARKLYGCEQEGVETVLQYLLKNVPVIKENPKRFSPAYIYRVSYNCLYCICHDRQCDRDKYELEMSNIQSVGDSEEINLFDTIIQDDPVAPTYQDLENEEIKSWFWDVIEDMGLDTQAVIDQILYGGHLKRVNQKKKREIIEILKENLDIFKEFYYV